MSALHKEHTIVLNKEFCLPSRGIICAHPGRVEKIALNFLASPKRVTDYRGYQVYTGFYKERELFIANTGIGSPAAAFLIEELVAHGAKRIIRLGSNDSSFSDYGIKLVKSTSLPLGLINDYQYDGMSIDIHSGLLKIILNESERSSTQVTVSYNQHIDGYYAVNFLHSRNSLFDPYSSSDMESGALYLLGSLYHLEYASLLLTYPKHNGLKEYQDGGKSYELEDKGIELALNSIVAE